jgi:hypothetical protein
VNEASRHPAAPAPGSPRYFALLYTPERLRGELSTLLAVADEIGAHASRSADHSIAHVRLEWWRSESERFARGEPQHPWLKAMLAQYPATSQLNLQSLVEAAAIDLATQTLQAPPGHALQRALFALVANALSDPPLSQELQQAVGQLGASAQQLEHAAAADEARAELRKSLRTIDGAKQPQLAPLMVWLALLARRSRRRSSLLNVLSDNLVAWKAARQAARGQFTIN